MQAPCQTASSAASIFPKCTASVTTGSPRHGKSRLALTFKTRGRDRNRSCCHIQKTEASLPYMASQLKVGCMIAWSVKSPQLYNMRPQRCRITRLGATLQQTSGPCFEQGTWPQTARGHQMSVGESSTKILTVAAAIGSAHQPHRWPLPRPQQIEQPVQLHHRQQLGKQTSPAALPAHLPSALTCAL